MPRIGFGEEGDFDRGVDERAIGSPSIDR